MDKSAFEKFGGIEKEEKAHLLLEEHKNRWLKVLHTLQQEKIVKDVAPYVNKIQNLRPIPFSATYRKTNNDALDTQIENQVEMQVELQVAVQSDAYIQGMEPWQEWKWSSNLDVFKDDFLKPISVTTGWLEFLYHYSNPPLYKAHDVLKQAKNPKLAAMNEMFDDKFLVTNNFIQRRTKSFKEVKAEPFSWYAKPVFHLLVAQEKDGSITTLVIDQNDLPFFREKLQQDEGNGSRKLCIYNPSVGIVLEGKETFDEKALKEHPEFVRHLIYAKFWNGNSAYTAKEITVLEEWIKRVGLQKMWDCFHQIVRNREDSAKKFEGSSLQRVFEKLFREAAREALIQRKKAPLRGVAAGIPA
ncbi:MAG: hypothetical protein FJZ63_07465 [Chlamydiae bacterium]|nr:hypothetical protein [Chlamydiota bacterium]